MATQVVMPQMGYDMTEGTVVKWVKKEGDLVKRGEVIAEIETDKATVEMESEAGGILRRIVIRAGSKVPVGQVIAYIGTADEAIPDVPKAGSAAQAQAVAPAPAPTIPAPSVPTHGAPTLSAHGPASSPRAEEPAGELKVSPIARRLADERGIDLRRVTGTGPGGRITKEDVEAFGKQPAPTAPAAAASAPAAAPAQGMRPGYPPRKPGADGRIALGRMGQAIARSTQATMRDTPIFYVTVQVDMTRGVEFRRELNDALGAEVRVSINDLIVKACTLALVKFPVFNAVFKGDHLAVQPHINIGIAVALPEGLVAPAVLECERKSLVQIAKDSHDVAVRARGGTLKQDEYSGTFSVSNLGMFDVDAFTAIIVSPQVAVLAVGAVQAQPVVRDGQVTVRQMMSATLSTDHRAANGAESAQFMAEVKRILENPMLLVAQEAKGG